MMELEGIESTCEPDTLVVAAREAALSSSLRMNLEVAKLPSKQHSDPYRR